MRSISGCWVFVAGHAGIMLGLHKKAMWMLGFRQKFDSKVRTLFVENCRTHLDTYMSTFISTHIFSERDCVSSCGAHWNINREIPIMVVRVSLLAAGRKDLGHPHVHACSTLNHNP